MNRRLLAATAFLLLSAACEQDRTAQAPSAVPAAGESAVRAGDGAIGGEEPANPPEKLEPVMGETRECVNREKGYSLEYPADWQVNDVELLGPCALFDPDPIEVPENSELPPAIAVAIDVEPVPFATVTGEVIGRREISREATIVDGRTAVRMEAESTGEGLHDRGLRSYHYFIDLGGAMTIVATTHGVGDTPFERKRRILDAMMATLEFHEPE